MFGVVETLVAPALCAAVATAAQPIVIRFLRRAAVVDVPGIRSSHSVPTLRGGGIAVVLGLVFGTALVPSGNILLPLVVALLAFGAIGVVEDLQGISVRLRLALQIAASATVGAMLVTEMTHPAMVLLAAAIIAVWVAGFVNVFNFMDGINGISGGHALLGGLVFAALGAWRGDASMVAAALTVAAGGLAFLPWNAIRARVFLGDVGSYALGAGMAVLAAYAVMRGVPPEAAIAPLALYLADTAWTLQRRIRAREPWLEPHRTHVYQRLCDLGWSHQRVAATTVGIALLVSLLGAASLSGIWQLRVLADCLGVLVLATYLRAPTLLATGRHQIAVTS